MGDRGIEKVLYTLHTTTLHYMGVKYIKKKKKMMMMMMMGKTYPAQRFNQPQIEFPLLCRIIRVMEINNKVLERQPWSFGG